MNWIDCIDQYGTDTHIHRERKKRVREQVQKPSSHVMTVCMCVGIHYVWKQWGNRASNVIKPIRMIQIDLIPLFSIESKNKMRSGSSYILCAHSQKFLTKESIYFSLFLSLVRYNVFSLLFITLVHLYCARELLWAGNFFFFFLSVPHNFKCSFSFTKLVSMSIYFRIFFWKRTKQYSLLWLLSSDQCILHAVTTQIIPLAATFLGFIVRPLKPKLN